jgi:hypothetical protein
MVGAMAAGATEEMALLCGAGVATSLRAAALRTDYRLPAWQPWG